MRAGAAFALSSDPTVTVEGQTFDFGAVDRGASVEHTFRLHNAGGDVLRIDHVKSSCGCTVGVVSGREVAPGQDTFVAVHLDTAHLSGRTTKVVTVYTNDPASPNVGLTLTGRVDSDLVATPTPLYLGKIRHGDGLRRELTVVSGRPGGTHRVTDVSNSNPSLHATLEPADGGGQRVVVEVDRDVPLGRFSDELKLHTTSPTESEITIPVLGNVEGDMVVLPPQVTFGITRGGPPPSRDLRIRNRGARAVAITKIVAPTDLLTYDLSTVEDGVEYKLALHLRPGLSPGKVEGAVEIYTDHPTESHLVVPLYAIVRDGRHG